MNREPVTLMQQMNRVMKLHRQTLHRLTQDVEVYPGQPPLLFRLMEQDGQTQHELAQKLKVQPATLTVMISRMVKNGHVERKRDERDQRVSRVYLTDKGRHAASVLRSTLHQMDDSCLESFSPEEKELLNRMLLRIQHHLLSFESKDQEDHTGEKNE